MTSPKIYFFIFLHVNNIFFNLIKKYNFFVSQIYMYINTCVKTFSTVYCELIMKRDEKSTC